MDRDIKYITTEVNKAITHIARGSGFTVEEVKEITAKELNKYYKKD